VFIRKTGRPVFTFCKFQSESSSTEPESLQPNKTAQIKTDKIKVLCLLPVACCLLPVACCLLPVACCLLPVASLWYPFSPCQVEFEIFPKYTAKHSF
jgi:hypothetical protein